MKIVLFVLAALALTHASIVEKCENTLPNSEGFDLSTGHLAEGGNATFTFKIPTKYPVVIRARVAGPKDGEFEVSLEEHLKCNKLTWWEKVSHSFSKNNGTLSFKSAETSKAYFRLVVTATKGSGCFSLYRSVKKSGEFAQDHAAAKSEAVSEVKHIAEQVKKMVSATSKTTIVKSSVSTKPKPITTATKSLISKKERQAVKEEKRQLKQERKELAKITTFHPSTKLHLFEKKPYGPGYNFKASEGWKKFEDTLTPAVKSKTLTLTKIPRGVRVEGALRTEGNEQDFDLRLEEEIKIKKSSEWVNVDLSWSTKKFDDVQFLTTAAETNYRWRIFSYKGNGKFVFYYREEKEEGMKPTEDEEELDETELEEQETEGENDSDVEQVDEDYSQHEFAPHKL